MTALQIIIEATDGDARAGVVSTARGSFATPCFMPVGTRGAVRAVSTADLEDLGADVMLANTYHLMLRPGADVVAELGGVHGFASWDNHVLTDSGGFQVFSLGADVDDDGVTFRSTYDGSSQRLTPERAVAAQELLGADIQVALDVCPPLPSPPEVVRLAVERTAAWARRAKDAHRRPGQALFCVVQGGLDAKLRAQSARRSLEVGFDGYAVGGLSVGESRAEMLDALAATVAELPPTNPATSWAWATPWAWWSRWRWASTCSTACGPPAWPATGRCSPPRAASTCATPPTLAIQALWTPPARVPSAPAGPAPTCATC